MDFEDIPSPDESISAWAILHGDRKKGQEDPQKQKGHLLNNK